MSDCEAVQADIVAEFSLFEDWQERYRHIIELGRLLPPYPEAQRQDQFLVRGCQSRVWLHPRLDGGLLHFDADSDALIVAGLVALVLRVYSGQPPAVIRAVEPHFIREIGLSDNLSLTRSNGLQSVINTMKSYAASAAASGG